MKNLLSNGILIVITIGILYIIFLRECKHDKCPPKGYVVVSDAFIDSLKKVANKPPVIIIKDTIIYKEKIVYVNHPIPYPDPIDSEKNIYRDSIWNDSVRVGSIILVKGVIEQWKWWYQPIIHVKTITIETTKPVPVPYEVMIPKSGVYISGKFGGNENSFIYGADLDLINKKDNIYGLQYQRFGKENLYSFKIGIKIKFNN